MNAFSDELRKERETRGITLADIARKTRVNIKYLEALEQGAFDVLPQTYIRAFIRSYAEAIGISSDQFLHKYDVIVTQRYTGGMGEQPGMIQSTLIPTKEKETEIRKEKKMRMIIISAFIVVTAILVGIYIVDTVGNTVSTDAVKETSFQEVVREQEESAVPPAVIDSVDTTKSPSPFRPDSLVLRAVASDSVWITIIRDSLPPRSGYMLKGRYRTYIAQKEFTVSLSDGGSIRFFLNGKEIGPIGTKGERVRNVKITSESLTP